MGLQFYLALEPWEFQTYTRTEPMVWFSCQFSPEPPGICNLPEALPTGAAILLDDALPYSGNARAVTEGLKETVEKTGAAGVILDFQKPYEQTLGILAEYLERSLPCPVVVTPSYADHTKGPLLLPPAAMHIPLVRQLSSIRRSIWLELDAPIVRLTLTERGLRTASLYALPFSKKVFESEKLHCHYQVHGDGSFTLHRTGQDLTDFLQEAESLGVEAAIGFWQELQALL